MYSSIKGVDPSNHEVRKELERIKPYIVKSGIGKNNNNNKTKKDKEEESEKNQQKEKQQTSPSSSSIVQPQFRINKDSTKKLLQTKL